MNFYAGVSHIRWNYYTKYGIKHLLILLKTSINSNLCPLARTQRKLQNIRLLKHSDGSGLLCKGMEHVTQLHN